MTRTTTARSQPALTISLDGTRPSTTRRTMNRTQWTESFYLAERCNEHAVSCSWHHEKVGVPSVCVSVCTQITGDDGDGSLLRSGHRGARGEDRVASSSGSVLEGGAGEEPVIMCLYTTASLAKGVDEGFASQADVAKLYHANAPNIHRPQSLSPTANSRPVLVSVAHAARRRAAA